MKLAIVKLSAMGDIIHAMVALEFIKKHNSDIQIDWIVESSFVSILENNPNINQILPINLKSIKKEKKELIAQLKLLRQYAKNNYDLVIDAQGLIKSAISAKLLGSKVAGFDKNSIREKIASFLYDIKVDIAYDANTIDRNAKVLSHPLNLDITTDDILQKSAFLFYDDSHRVDNLIKNSQKNIVFVVGSTWESRNYPKEKFVEIANELKENILVCWGNKDEYEKAKYIELHSTYAKATPRLNLNELKALIAKSDLTIGNDTGPTHMAWGLNRPSITIFGPTPTSRVYITDINKVVKSNSIVNPYKLNKEDFSIQEIESKEIVDLAKKLLHVPSRL
jgi:heptosyltransferase-1